MPESYTGENLAVIIHIILGEYDINKSIGSIVTTCRHSTKRAFLTKCSLVFDQHSALRLHELESNQIPRDDHKFLIDKFNVHEIIFVTILKLL